MRFTTSLICTPSYCAICLMSCITVTGKIKVARSSPGLVCPVFGVPSFCGRPGLGFSNRSKFGLLFSLASPINVSRPDNGTALVSAVVKFFLLIVSVVVIVSVVLFVFIKMAICQVGLLLRL